MVPPKDNIVSCKVAVKIRGICQSCGSLASCIALGQAWAKKGYTAAAHFGTNRIGRNSAEKREGPKPGSKNSAWGWSPYFLGFVGRLSIVSTLRTGKLTIFE